MENSPSFSLPIRVIGPKDASRGLNKQIYVLSEGSIWLARFGGSRIRISSEEQLPEGNPPKTTNHSRPISLVFPRSQKPLTLLPHCKFTHFVGPGAENRVGDGHGLWTMGPPLGSRGSPGSWCFPCVSCQHTSSAMGSTAAVAVHGLNEAPAICSRGIPQAVVSFVEPPVPMAGVSGAAPCIVEGIPPLGFPPVCCLSSSISSSAWR